MLDITDFHGQNAPREELEEVVILPIGEYEDGDIVTLPSGYTWSDFEYLETAMTVEGSPENTYGPGRFLKEDILNSPTSWSFRVSWTNNTAFLAVRLDYLSDTTATVVAQGPIATQRLKYLYGYKRRYATKNLSRTISVNLGNDIAVNSRYEVDLPSEFYESDGSIKKGVKVRAEIFNNSGTGVAEWGETGNYTDSSSRRFAKASVVADKVIVQTGQTGIAAVSSQGGNGLGLTTNITSAPCRVIATLTEKAVVSIEGGGGITEHNDATGRDAAGAHPSTAITLTTENPKTVYSSLHELEAGKLNVDEFKLANALDVLHLPNTPSFLYCLDDNIYRSAKLQKNTNVIRNEATVKNVVQQVIVNPTTHVEVVMPSNSTVGTGLDVVGNGIQIQDASVNWEMYITLPIETNAFNGILLNSFPLVVRVEMMVNGAASGVFADIPFDTNGNTIIKTPKITSNDLSVVDNDIVTVAVYYQSRNQENATDELIVNTGAFMFAEVAGEGAAEYGIPATAISSKEYKVQKNVAQAIGDTGLGSLLEYTAATLERNNTDMSFDAVNNRHIVSIARKTIFHVLVSQPFSKAGGGGTGGVRMFLIAEHSTDSTDGIDGTWTQIHNPVATTNTRTLSLSDGGAGTGEFTGELILTAAGMYRLSVYALDIDSGSITATGELTGTDGGFAWREAGFIELTEASLR